MIRRPPRSTQGVSSAASDVYKRQVGSGVNHGQRQTDPFMDSLQQYGRPAALQPHVWPGHQGCPGGAHHADSIRMHYFEDFGVPCHQGIRSCFELFEMFFEVKRSSFSSRFFSQIAPLSSLEEAVETEVFHSQPSARTEGNRTCSDCRGEQQGKSCLLYTSPSPRD